MRHAVQVNDIFSFIELIIGVIAIGLQMALKFSKDSLGRFFVAAPMVIEKDQFQNRVIINPEETGMYFST